MRSRRENIQILISSLLAAGVMAILLILSLNGFWAIINAQGEEAKTNLLEVSGQYKTAFLTQIEGDFQTVRAIATFAGQSDLAQEKLMDILEEENEKSEFLRIGYIDAQGIGAFVEKGGKRYTDIELSGENLFQRALAGEEVLSGIRQSVFSTEQVNCYAVPVWKQGEISGVLVASERVTQFSKTLAEPLFGGLGYVHIIGQTGEFLLCPDSDIESDHPKNLMELGKIEKEDLFWDAIEKQESYFGEVNGEKDSFWMTIQPLKINDWYVLVAIPKNVLNENFVHLMIMFFGVVVSIILLFSILFFYIEKTRRKGREEIEKIAYYDSLTGAPNKICYMEQAGALLQQRGDYALVLFNIDNFKYINEVFGYQKGDALLCHIAKVLKKNMREKEIYYRDNADYFGCMIRSADRDEITERVKSIQNEICRYQFDQNQEYNIICHCGVKIAGMHSHRGQLDVLMDRTKMALNAGRSSHLSTICFYNDELHKQAKLQSEIESRMRQALKKHEFVVNLQPKYWLKDKTMHSAEALVRWIPEDGKTIYPDEFIPIFEKNGFISELDMYMLEEVCRLQSMWIKKGYPVVPIAVNQSRIFFYEERFLERIETIVNRYQVPPSLLILEVTESISTENREHAQEVIRRLHRMGIAVSMDDFGSGYSSLNLLKDLEIDELKLDRVFLTGDADPERKRVVIRNIIRLAKELSIRTVTEGVETEEQMAFLKEVDCDVAQGYYFARPMTVEAFEAMQEKTANEKSPR